MYRLQNSPWAQRRAATLLELLLALALSILIILAIGMAIRLNLVTLQTKRSSIEQVTLARAVLRHIADDLRNAVLYRPEAAAAFEKVTADSGANASSATAAAQAAGLSTGSSAASQSASNSSTATSVVPKSIPGLYGNESQLQVDISRLPKIDEYQLAVMDESTASIPSDVKTVTYFVVTDAEPINTGFQGPAAPTSGLYRRELDRAVTAYAADNANVASIDRQGEILAAEVTGVAFQYFDGSAWATSWNTEERGGLPLAVEVSISVRSENPSEAEAVFRLVVRLPVASLITADSTTTDSSNSTGTQSGQSTPSGGASQP